MMNSIILIGFMGSGKTTVGKELSSLSALPFFDMDEMVLKKTKCSTMHALFAKGGELLLRETEITIAKEYSSSNALIMATGGGAVHNKIIVDYLKKQQGIIYFLDASLATIQSRLKESQDRPLLKDAESLYHFRRPLYTYYADHVIDVENKSVTQIAEEILYRQ